MALVLAYAFDEVSGTTAADASGNNHPGTLVGAPAWSGAGQYGGAIDFDAVNDAVTFGTLGLFSRPARVAAALS
jgi:hypothetical protein